MGGSTPQSFQAEVSSPRHSALYPPETYTGTCKAYHSQPIETQSERDLAGLARAWLLSTGPSEQVLEC